MLPFQATQHKNIEFLNFVSCNSKGSLSPGVLQRVRKEDSKSEASLDTMCQKQRDKDGPQQESAYMSVVRSWI